MRGPESAGAPAFVPHPWLRDPHAMTLAALLPRGLLGAKDERLPDDEELVVEVGNGPGDEFVEGPRSRVVARLHRSRASATDAPLAVLVHGLSGSADSGPVRGLARKLHDRGFHVARMNLRNCGGTEELATTLYCTAQSADAFDVARAARERTGATRVHLIGWSMGGNLVLKLAGKLGELGDGAPPWLASVAAVSPALDLEGAQRALDEIGSNEPYRRYFLRQFATLYERQARRFAVNGDGTSARFPIVDPWRVATFREWDERVTAPHFGFADADDFYRRGGARGVLARVIVPVCVIHAKDDPFVPFAPWRDGTLRPAGRFVLHAPEFGGHASFVAASRGADSDRFWAEARLCDFLMDLERLGAERSSAGTVAEGIVPNARVAGER